jgi:K+-transporting ATPase KdpF subunit
MVMPPGHGSEAQRLRPLQRREKLLAGGVGGILAIALAIVLLVSLTHADRHSGHGCIAVSLAYSMGGTQDYRCGAAARAMCSEVDDPGLTGAAGRDVARACRRAGLPVS